MALDYVRETKNIYRFIKWNLLLAQKQNLSQRSQTQQYFLH